MKRFILLLLFSFFAIQVFPQWGYFGTITDSKTGKPVSNVYAVIKSRGTGSVSNQDGKFFINDIFSKNGDTISFSCVGYKTEILVSVREGDLGNIKLTPLVYKLKQIDIHVKKKSDYPYRLFDAVCKKYRKLDQSISSKGYFSFSSRIDSIPLEIIESYYNAKVSVFDGVESLRLKNGRVGFVPSNFLSLNTTSLLSGIRLFSLSGNRNIPAWGGNFKLPRIRKMFDVSISSVANSDGEKQYVMEIRPVKDDDFFSATLYLNAGDTTIDRIDFNLFSKEYFYYLRPVIPGDQTDSVCLSLQYFFENNGSCRLRQILIRYSLNYTSNDKIRYPISSEGRLILYDEGNLFPEIIPADIINEQNNDYRAISTIPYDSLFWQLPGITPRSNHERKYADFFRSKGIILNFPHKVQPVCLSSYVFWRMKPSVQYNDFDTVILKARRKYENAIKTYDNKKPNFDIIYRILINPVQTGDTLHLTSVTLMDIRHSWFQPDFSIIPKAYINTIFDLYELRRRRIINLCSKEKNLTSDKIMQIYDRELTGLNDTLKILSRETGEGTLKKPVTQWVEHLYKTSDIKRMDLINELNPANLPEENKVVEKEKL